MPAGQFIVRKNISNVDELPDLTGSNDSVLLRYDGEVETAAEVLSYSDGKFVTGETGLFLIMVSEHWGADEIATNEGRVAVGVTFWVDGLEIFPGYCNGYIRRQQGSFEFINHCVAIIRIAGTDGTQDEIEVRGIREDPVMLGGIHRIPGKCGASILKLDDTWKFAHYESAAEFIASQTLHDRTGCDIGNTIEQAAPFTRIGNAVDIDSTQHVLALYTFKNDPTSTITNRCEMQGLLRRAGAELSGTWMQCYGPRLSGQNLLNGGMSRMALLSPGASGEDLELLMVGRDTPTCEWRASLQLLELPISIEKVILRASSGNMNAVNGLFNWSDALEIDLSTFEYENGDSQVKLKKGGDYLAISSQAITSDAGDEASGRSIPAAQFSISGNGLPESGSSTYHRSTNTSNHGSISNAGILANLTADELVGVFNDAIGLDLTNAVATEDARFTLIRFGSIFPEGAFVSEEIFLTGYEIEVELQGYDVETALLGIVNHAGDAHMDRKLKSQNFQMVQNNNKVLSFTVIDQEGKAVDISGATISWGMALSAKNKAALIECTTISGITIVDGPGGKYKVSVPAIGTKGLSPAQYYWQSLITSATGKKTTVGFGYIELMVNLLDQ